MKNLPKILIISGEPFNKDNATGITLSNLFDGWDKNKLAQIYINNNAPCTDVCSNYFHLKPQHAFIDYYLRKLLTFSIKNRNSITRPSAVPLSNQERNIKTQIHLNLRAIADFSYLYVPSNLYSWVKAFRPDIIYSMLGSVRMINLTNTIARTINKPVVPHFMDDWPTTLYTQNELMGFARYQFEKKLNNVFSLSKGGLCISELMSKEYEARYHLPFISFSNCVDDSFFCQPINPIGKKTILLMYVGGLHLNRWKSLLQLSNAIEEANRFQNKILLKIYAPIKDINAYAGYFSKFSSTQFGGSLKSDEVSSTLKIADILLHVESFDDNYARFTKYSLSTKIPQYMATGKPILAFGPSGLASIEHIKKVNAGKVICEWNEQNLIENVRNFASNPEILFLYATNGFEYAKKNYSKKNNLIELAKVLNKLSDK